MDINRFVKAKITVSPVSSPNKLELKRPAKYKVLLINDDYTPMDFVVEILIRFFFMTIDAANNLMLCIHQQGKAECGTYTRDIAETKVHLVSECAKSNNYPLLCIMKEVF